MGELLPGPQGRRHAPPILSRRARCLPEWRLGAAAAICWVQQSSGWPHGRGGSRKLFVEYNKQVGVFPDGMAGWQPNCWIQQRGSGMGRAGWPYKHEVGAGAGVFPPGIGPRGSGWVARAARPTARRKSSRPFLRRKDSRRTVIPHQTSLQRRALAQMCQNDFQPKCV